jgi:hypothetical protein
MNRFAKIDKLQARGGHERDDVVLIRQDSEPPITEASKLSLFFCFSFLLFEKDFQ